MRGSNVYAALQFLVGLISYVVTVDLEDHASREIRIGGLFETGFSDQEKAFRFAIDRVNARRDILPFTRLIYDVEHVPAQDSFTASKKVCKQLREGVAAIFGPMSGVSSAHVQSVCHQLELPHIETRWDFRDDKNYLYSHSINLYPYHKPFSKAFLDLVTKWHWKEFTILYEESTALIKLQEILQSPKDKNMKITARRLEKVDGTYRPVLKDLQKRGASRMIIDCDFTNVHSFLLQAMQLRMIGLYYHYHFTTLDLRLVNLDLFKESGTNITAFQLIDPNNTYVREVTSSRILEELRHGNPPADDAIAMRDLNNTGKHMITTETALIYDAVHLFGKALHEASRAQDIETKVLTCSRAQPWKYGSSLINYMRITQVKGLSGTVKFDNEGRRSEFELQLVELEKNGLEKSGYWWNEEGESGINMTKDYNEQKAERTDSLKNTSLRVVTIKEDPYVMLKDDPHGQLKGNDRFEGYCVDLLQLLAERQEFNYTIHLVKDGQYGAKTENGWTGMVRELMDREADLAVASLSISYGREQVMDFTKPFMNLGISILFKRPEKKDPSLFSFLSPLSIEIWVYMLAAYLVVSFTLFVLARFSPYEWYNPHPCNDDPDYEENQFTLMNSLWFTIGSLMQQGSEVAPKALSTRIVSGIWWFFTLIMISSYTANLAAFLTVERMTSPIENADDLSKQTKIKYGTIYGGSTMTFFKESSIPTYERMWNFMSTHKPSVFVNETKEGIERVKKGNYAYLLESTMNEYITQRNCELMMVGGLLDSKGYGIGTPRGSPYRDILSDAILKLQEEQQLQRLYNKWWKQKGVTGKCDVDDKNKKDANALAIANVGGVFVVLVGGLVLSLIVALLEFVWKAHRNADEDKKPVCYEMGEELRFALRCMGSSKKPTKKAKAKDKHNSDNGVTLVPLTRGYVPANTKEYFT